LRTEEKSDILQNRAGSGIQVEAMDGQKQTLKGFIVKRRCDMCGMKIEILIDEGERCTLVCAHCGKEYKFYFKRS